MTQARRYFAKSVALPSEDEIATWFDTTRDLIAAVAIRHAREFKDFSATAVAVLSTGTQSVIAHVGDGCAVLREAESGRWIVPSWPQHGEYASTTYFVTDTDVLQLRITRVHSALTAFAVFSDGIERLALDFTSHEPAHKLFNKLSAPISASTSIGRDADLSRALKEFLSSPTVNSRTDDDKSLIVAVVK